MLGMVELSVMMVEYMIFISLLLLSLLMSIDVGHAVISSGNTFNACILIEIPLKNLFFVL